MTIVELSLK